MNMLITSSSFLTAVGTHHQRISPFEVIKAPGPLTENELLQKLTDLKSLDYYVCGDDEISQKVLDELFRLGIRRISKYGVGLDSIDLDYAKIKGIEVKNCAGINAKTVAEHTLSLLLFWAKRFKENVVLNGAKTWSRAISRDISGLSIGIIGLGNIGIETAKIVSFLGAKVSYYDPFIVNSSYARANCIDDLKVYDVLIIHTVLNSSTEGLVDDDFLRGFHGELIVNMSRAKIIEENGLINWLLRDRSNTLLTDVLYEEPPKPDNWMLSNPQVIVTPHVGSRSSDCIEKTANRALDNLGI